MSNNPDNKNTEKRPIKRQIRLLLINLAAMGAVVVAAVLITFRWIDSYTEHNIAIKVPDITGMQEQEAIDYLAQHDLEGIASDRVFIKGVPAGEITAQRPAAEAKVKRGRKIYLTVSSGNQPMIAIPDIIDNCSLREAESRLRASGFKLAPHDTIAGDLDWVYGVRYEGRELKSQERVPEGAQLTIVVGGGNKEESDIIEAPTVEDDWF
jgi:beta-lactam-binding protein with PASTA domain